VNSKPQLTLDVNDWSNDTNAEVHLYTLTNTAWNQQWNYSSSAGTIVSKMNGHCLEVENGTPEDAIPAILNPCDGSNKQKWDYDADTGRVTSALNASYCLDGGSFFNCSDFPDRAYCDPDLTVDARLDDLVPRITAVQAAGMLRGYHSNGIGVLGVPVMNFAEALHGALCGCGAASGPESTGCPTSFPHALVTGASFNRTLWRSMATAISYEARALGNQGVWGTGLAWAPDINLFRDPRWGRGQEVPGEDPVLNSEYAFEYITGLQGLDEEDYIRVVATPKHFSAYDLENWNGTQRYEFNAVVTYGELVEYFWPAFRSAFERG